MAEITTQDVRELLSKIQGQRISLRDLRTELNILPGTKSFDIVRNIMFQLAEQKVVRPSARGEYTVVREVKPVPVFSVQRERKPPFDLLFPRDFDSGEPFDFSYDIVVREGDAVLISGVSNFGKTAICMNFLGENIDKHPVLMGNEYTTPDNEPTPRFLSRLDGMGWVEWCDNEGNDNFTLLPVHGDYAEHIVKDKINLIDWVNIETGEHFMIGNIINECKRAVGRGIVIIAIQKGEGFEAGRGGQFTKDFADVEFLIDKYSDDETLLTVGKVKEYKRRVTGRSWAYKIVEGVKLVNVREVRKCHACYGKGYTKSGKCYVCDGKKFLEVAPEYLTSQNKLQ